MQGYGLDGVAAGHRRDPHDSCVAVYAKSDLFSPAVGPK